MIFSLTASFKTGQRTVKKYQKGQRGGPNSAVTEFQNICLNSGESGRERSYIDPLLRGALQVIFNIF